MGIEPPGRYQLGDCLHAGRIADLYRAYDTVAARYVALKMFRAEIAAGEGFAGRLRAHMDRLAGLSHPHIVQLYGGDVVSASPFLAMEYVDGGTLGDRLVAYRDRGERMPLDEVLRLLTRVASALDYAHGQDVLHGALTPARILCTRLNEPVLTGFGLALLLTAAGDVFTAGGGVAGAPAYSSPEQAAGHPGDARSDLYALGMILYEMVAGRGPFEGEAATLLDRSDKEPPPPRQFNPELSPAIQDVILQALARDPSGRFASAREIALAFKEAWSTAGPPHVQTPPPVPEEAIDTRVIGGSVPVLPGAPAGNEPVAERIGRYQIERELGRGGMAVVYLARDPYMSREVAIKVVSREATHYAGFQERFQYEARLIASLEHACIVRVYDFGIREGDPFMVMQYLAGGSLSTRLARGPLAVREMAPILDRVAAGLDAAHAAGVVHRDIKPGNILFDPEHNAYLSDFGISIRRQRHADSFATSGMPAEDEVGGTPRYMSPEQVRAMLEKTSIVLDGGSDIYSLGLVLFEALTGRAAFQGATVYDAAVARLSEPVPQIRAARASVPAATQEIINRVLAADPAGRYPTAGDLARDFRELASGRWFLRRLAD
ncbi:MAG TPA: serine/threonine-protein kinase [Chloroflexota bacterium]|nr:serine/threonine-protein kinase [Chloroflexota bacterium]